MTQNALLLVVIVLFSALTVLNLLSWKHSKRTELELQTCVREYRLLLEEHPCAAAR